VTFINAVPSSAWPRRSDNLCTTATLATP